VLVVNNGAAALVLATTALAAGREVVVSRGEMVEIGDGFRLPDLIASTGARLREVGTTNRTHLRDYADAVGPQTGCVLKVHPSNFRVEGFTARSEVAELATLGVPVVADTGSGLLAPHPLLPDEPDAATALRAGPPWSPPAATSCSAGRRPGCCSAGPTSSSACAATRWRVRCGSTSSSSRRSRRPCADRPRRPGRRCWPTDGPAGQVRGGRRQVGGTVVRATARSAAGGAPGQALPGWAVALPAAYAPAPARRRPCVVGRVERDRCLLDLRASRPAGRPARRGGTARRARRSHRRPRRPRQEHARRALTGMEPDRWAEERRRGMTIDLGYAWATLPTATCWPSSTCPAPALHRQHAARSRAGTGGARGGRGRRGLAPAVRRAPGRGRRARPALRAARRHAQRSRRPRPAVAEAQEHLRTSSLGDVEAVAVSGATGAGLDDLRAALARLVAGLPPPDLQAPVRLWVDRAFTVRGSGTVVTGTLGAGVLRTGDELRLGERTVRVRGLQRLGTACDEVAAVARVAVNLRGVERTDVARGDALLTPTRGAPPAASTSGCRATRGTCRPSSSCTSGRPPSPSGCVRSARTPRGCCCTGPWPLRAGDRALLRDPGAQAVAAGVLVLDADPPALRRRGAAADRAEVLRDATGRPGPRRRGAPAGRRATQRAGRARGAAGRPGGRARRGGVAGRPRPVAAWAPALAAAVDAHAPRRRSRAGCRREAARQAVGPARTCACSRRS
jgi:hypothetical protein